MSKINLTENQQKVVDFFGNNLLVSASAGSGKTRVLINKIINVILNEKAKLDEILVVTFTNAAATEMRLRLRKEIEKSDLKNKENELSSLSTADISTFHKFCQKVIAEFGYKIGQNASFSIADESLSGFLMNEALNTIIFNLKKNASDEELDLIETFYQNRSDADFKQTISSIYKFLCSKADPLTFTTEVLNSSYNENLNENTALQYLNEKLMLNLSQILNAIKKLEIDAEIFSFQILTNSLIEMKNYLLQFNNEVLNNLKLLESDYELKKINLRKLTEEQISLKEEFNGLVDDFRKSTSEIKDILKITPTSKTSQEIGKLKRRIDVLLQIVFKFKTEYERIKTDKNLLDFGDLERQCLQILSCEDVVKIIQNRYKFIFIDEYQDTSRLQEEIIEKITSGNNLIMVGDIKQSIYNFRQCEPQIFINKFNLYKENSENGNVIELNQNFRSETEILNFSNYIFEKIMLKETADISYKDNSKFVFGEKVKPSTTNNIKKVQLHILEKEEHNEEKFLSPIYSIKDDQLKITENSTLKNECYLVAKLINQLLKEKIYDEDLKEYRNLKFSDIAVLSRSKSQSVKQLKTVLEQCGIPVSTDYSFYLFESIDVRLILNILEVVNNYYNDIALTACLNSYAGGLSENSEYDAAKTKEAQLEMRIAELESKIKNAKIISKDDLNTNIVNVGCTVTLLDVEFDEEVTYTLMGATDSDPLNGIISNTSPMGKALIGKKVGDQIIVEAPNGNIEYKLLKIEIK